MPYPIGMPDRINPRPIFRRAVEMLASAECPSWGKVLGARNLVSNRPVYYCTWCAARETLVDEYKEWQRQDAAPNKKPRRNGAR